jgi:hypothetical protein
MLRYVKVDVKFRLGGLAALCTDPISQFIGRLEALEMICGRLATVNTRAAAKLQIPLVHSNERET